jgi:hypothetical protein
MRLRVEQERPTDLNDTTGHAVELDAFDMAERRQTDLREAGVVWVIPNLYPELSFLRHLYKNLVKWQ